MAFRINYRQQQHFTPTQWSRLRRELHLAFIGYEELGGRAKIAVDSERLVVSGVEPEAGEPFVLCRRVPDPPAAAAAEFPGYQFAFDTRELPYSWLVISVLEAAAEIEPAGFRWHRDPTRAEAMAELMVSEPAAAAALADRFGLDEARFRRAVELFLVRNLADQFRLPGPAPAAAHAPAPGVEAFLDELIGNRYDVPGGPGSGGGGGGGAAGPKRLPAVVGPLDDATRAACLTTFEQAWHLIETGFAMAKADVQARQEPLVILSTLEKECGLSRAVSGHVYQVAKAWVAGEERHRPDRGGRRR